MQKSVFKIILVIYIITLSICCIKTEFVEYIPEDDVMEDKDVDAVVEKEENHRNYDLPDELIIPDELLIKDDDIGNNNDVINDNGSLNTEISTTKPVENENQNENENEDENIIGKIVTENQNSEGNLNKYEKPSSTINDRTKSIMKGSQNTNPINNNIKQTPQSSNKGITTLDNEENKIAPIKSFNTNDDANNFGNNNDGSYGDNYGEINVDNSNINDINESEGSGLFGNVNGNKKNSSGLFMENIGTIIIFVGAVSVGLIAVSGYQVYKRKNEKGLKSQEYFVSSLTQTTSTPSIIYENENENKPKITLDQSFIFDTEAHNQAYDMYNSAKQLEEEKEEQRKQDVLKLDTLPNQSVKTNPRPLSIETSITSNSASLERNSLNRSFGRSTLSRSLSRSLSRNSIVRHSFLNPNIRVVRTGKRTQQLFEATSEHPAIIETFPSMERPFEPAVPVPLEESDNNYLHPHSIYQMYQEDMEVDKYYAYTIEDKEYIIDPSTNRVLEIHDLTTDEYSLVEEELYLDFSGSEDSDSDKQTL